jgi:putative two-component system response regulator
VPEGNAITEIFQSGQASTTDDRAPTRVVTPTRILLEDLLVRSLIVRDDWDALPEAKRHTLQEQTDSGALLKELVERGLLTDYQANRVRGGKLNGLFFGKYRVLDRLGAGGMGVVYKAEHVLLRRLAALKVLPHPFDEDVQVLSRFLAEIRSVAQLRHPNIVAAMDADRTTGSELEPAGWYYLVMEYIDGEDLDKYVHHRGPLSLTVACDLVCQMASALAEAHQHGLIHRDIKPSNVLVTGQGQIKLLDFGLARRLSDRRITEPGAVLGTLDYMAPEQATSGAAIDHRADIYALGGILCWCLTGKPPFPPRPNYTEQILSRRNQAPPPLRLARPDLPEGLEAIVARLMAVRPDDRYPTAQAVISALLPFLAPAAAAPLTQSALRSLVARQPIPFAGVDARVHHALVVDDNEHIRGLFRRMLEGAGLTCDEASNGRQALEAVRATAFDLVLLDINMPEMPGTEVLRLLRAQPPSPHLKIIMLSGEVSSDEMSNLLAGGADDYLTKPPSMAQLVARVRAALGLKDAQDRADLLNSHLLSLNAELERSLQSTTGDMTESRNALLLALAELGQMRAGKPAASLVRLQRGCRLLAGAAANLPAFAGQIDANFVSMLECCAPLHDIGLAALPDHIVRKPGKFEHDERLVMQTHTTLGADMLLGIARRHRSAVVLLQMAADIARHHHEAYDGRGYPDRIAGNAIPLAARMVAVADVYDALRSPRLHRPAMSHHFAVELILEGMPGRFDPQLLQTFRSQAPEFDCIVREMPNN